MWTAIIQALAPVLPAIILRLLGIAPAGSADQRELGRAEQQNADMKAGEDLIAKANEAAKKVEREDEYADDPNNRDRR